MGEYGFSIVLHVAEFFLGGGGREIRLNFFFWVMPLAPYFFLFDFNETKLFQSGAQTYDQHMEMW